MTLISGFASSCYPVIASWFALEFAKSGLVPAQWHDYFKQESIKSLQMMAALLNHPDWKDTDEHLSE
jgi:hypothetical protein